MKFKLFTYIRVLLHLHQTLKQSTNSVCSVLYLLLYLMWKSQTELNLILSFMMWNGVQYTEYPESLSITLTIFCFLFYAMQNLCSLTL